MRTCIPKKRVAKRWGDLMSPCWFWQASLLHRLLLSCASLSLHSFRSQQLNFERQLRTAPLAQSIALCLIFRGPVAKLYSAWQLRHRLPASKMQLRSSAVSSLGAAQQQLLTPVSHKAPFTCQRRASAAAAALSSTTAPNSSSSTAQPSSRRHTRLEPVAAAAPAAAAANATVEALKVVEVDLGDRSYPIYIGQHLLQDGARLRQHIPGNRVLVVTNTTIAPLYLQKCVLLHGCVCERQNSTAAT